MKTKSLWQTLSAGMKKAFSLAALLIPLGAAQVTGGASAPELLEKGIYTEETKGELSAASRIYQQIVEDPSADRNLVAQAQLRLGLCQLKLGNKPQAISALERLTQEFPDKEKLLAMVEQHMPQLLDELVKQIEQNYIQEVDRSELMETAIRAIVGKLDDQGLLRPNDLEFLNTNELAQMNVQVEQKLAGIGVIGSACTPARFRNTFAHRVRISPEWYCRETGQFRQKNRISAGAEACAGMGKCETGGQLPGGK